METWLQEWSPLIVQVTAAFTALALALRPVLARLDPDMAERVPRAVEVLRTIERVAQTLGSGVPPRTPRKDAKP